MPDGAAATAALLQEIVTALEHQKLIIYFDVVSSTILTYDVLLNLNVEMQHMWRKKWSFITILYLVQRYLPFFDTTILVLHHSLGEGLSISYCELNYRIDGWSFFIGIVLSEVLLTVRLWAVWKRSIPVAIGLVAFFLGCWVPCCVLFNTFLYSTQFVKPPLPNSRGCFIAGGSHILYLCWVLMMVYDSGTLIMILIPGIHAFRMGGSFELVKTVYRDGVSYYVFIFCQHSVLPLLKDFCLWLSWHLVVSMVNVAVIVKLPPDLLHLLSSFERVLHSILSSRAILHIRQIASASANPSLHFEFETDG
ncbi:hypothetical protein V5O48_012657 [Marasmius crinis-equi]|uniref:DUF6533 domain-containing protein n=1 Tax=Marasmius crinis-equi TaxID=585013 RepID=A0ABR3F268_9AGAR